MSVESFDFNLASGQNFLVSGLETNPSHLLEISLTSSDYVGTSLPELIPLASEIPIVSPFTLLGDVDRDEDVDKADADLLGRTRRDPLTGEDDPRDFYKDGKISGADIVSLLRYISQNTDKSAPVIEAGLLNDTGLNFDSITSDSTISGTVTDTSRVTRFLAGLNSTSFEDFTNIRGLLNSEGRFSITPEQLETINHNSPLGEGEHTLNFYGKDEWGNESFSQVTFTLISSVHEELNFSVMLGQRLSISLSEVFPDAVEATFLLTSDDSLPTGMLEGNDTLVFYPNGNEIGTYQFTVIAVEGDSQTQRDFRISVVGDPITTTRISGVIQNTNQQPLAGVLVELGNLQVYTNANGEFILESLGELPNDTLLIRGNTVTGNLSYPFVAEKLPLLLERDPITGVNNVISRPIYLPSIDTANAVTIDPNEDTIVTTNNLPGASVFVEKRSLKDQDGNFYTGQLSITAVPREFTPAALPENLMPDLVVTIQPGEMVFSTPAPLSLPNLAGYDPGTEMDLWSINPVTGLFDKVGIGRVSDDGTVIETISGGIRNSSWHFFTPPPVPADDASENDRNEDNRCDECKVTAPGTSEVQLHSGAVIETHDLVSYRSLGANRGLRLTYDSQRADPRPIVHFSYSNVSGNTNRRLVAELTVQQGGFSYDVSGGEHYWSLPSRRSRIDAALLGDLRSLASGRYEYELTTGLLQLNNTRLSGSTTTQTGKIIHVNGIGSGFGNGWGLSGLLEIVENADGSVLIIDGDGGELVFEPFSNGSYDSPPGDFSVLEKLSDGTFRRTMKDLMVYRFNEQNQLAQMSDRLGNTTRYLYNESGNLLKIIDPVGLETTFSYTDGKVTKITDPAHRETLLAYDLAGNLIKITDPDGTSRTWEYDSARHIISERDQRGNVEQTFYDEAGRADRAIRKDGSSLDFDPVQVQGLSQGNLTRNPVTAPSAFRLGAVESVYLDANGNQKTTRLDQAGQLVSSVDEVGVLPSVERNEENLVTVSRDARGNLTRFTYDLRGNLLTQQDSLSFGGQFIDISQTGRLFIRINEEDDESAFVSIPFTFEFYGQSYTEIAVSSNGLLSFGGTNTEYENQPLNGDGIGLLGFPSILPFWDDLETRSDGGARASVYTQVLGQEGSRQLVIQWQEVEAYAFDEETGEITFQVILTEGTNGIQFNYLDVEFEGNTDVVHGKGASATIGIWNSSNEFQQYSYNEAKLRNGLSLIVSESGFIEVSRSGKSTGGRYYTYDPVFNQLTSMTDELGRQTFYEIDPNNGNILAMTRVIGEVGGGDDLVTQFTYTSQGLVDLMTDPLGRVTDYDYDGLGRLISITDAVGTSEEATQFFEYDAAGNTTAFVDENGNRTEWQYDALNRLIKVIEADPDGEGILTSPITNYTYDEAGNLLSVTDALGQVTSNEYDVLNRLVKTTDSLNQVTTFTYDSLGNLLSVVDPLGNETQNIYDERNRLIKTIDPEGGISQFSYDLDNNLISVIDSVNNQTTFAYDARNRLIRETDSLGNSTLYEYDAVDNLIAQTDRNERRIEYQYDEIDRLINESWVGTEQVINYSYDKASNLISIVDQYSSLSFSYDNRDRLTSVDNLGTPNAPNVVLNYTYDGVGNMLSVQDTINGVISGTNSYIYDGLNRLIQLTQTGNGVSEKRVDFAYNAIGQYTSLNRYSDLGGDQLVNRTSYSYDSLNRLTNLSHSNRQSEVAFYEFVYDASSRITRITDIDRVTDYSYDDRNQLTGANHSNVNKSDESYSYDANGNRISSSVHGEEYETGPNNRLTSDGVYNYEYDDEGNLIKQIEIRTGNVQAFEWDYRNRLVAVIEQDSGENVIQRVEFTYDGFDRRISKTVDINPQDNVAGIVTHFVYNQDDVYLEFVDNDGVTGVNQPILSQRYLHGAGVDQVIAQEDGEGSVIWMLTDHLGTIRDLIDDEGDVINHLVYDSFGQVIIETDPNVDTRYLFTGREWDEEIGLYYYRARYYNAEMGRFISEDPIGFGGGDANLYRYVGNSPINTRDPSGFIDEELYQNLKQRLDWCYQKFGTDKNSFKPRQNSNQNPQNSCSPSDKPLFTDDYHLTSLDENPEQWLNFFDRRRHLFENVYKDNESGHEDQLKQKCREIQKRIRRLEQQRNIEKKQERNEFRIPEFNLPRFPIPIPSRNPGLV